MPKGFFIDVANNLLEPKHRKAMGTAIWEFMWCIDKMTKIDVQGIGIVFGGKPIKLNEIAKEIGITESKISKNLHKLQKAKYLELTTAPYGIIIKVNKAKKRFARKVKIGFPLKTGGLPLRDARFTLKVKRNIRQDQDNINDSTSTMLKTFKKPLIKSLKKPMDSQELQRRKAKAIEQLTHA